MKRFLGITLSLCCLGNFSTAQVSYNWANGFGGTGNDYGLCTAADASGNVYVTGYFENTVDFDPGAGVFNLTSAGTGDFFVSKSDAAGNLLWAERVGGTGNECAYSIALDVSGNIYISGSFQGTVDFDPSGTVFNLTSLGGYDVFITKLDPSGNLIWAERMGGSSDEKGYAMILDPSGTSVYITGYFIGSADFDPSGATFNLISAGSDDVFISKLDASGNFIWADRIGGSGIDIAHAVAVDPAGNVYTTGSFQGSADFDPSGGAFNMISAGVDDAFISKLDASGNFIWARKHGGTGSEYGYFLAADSLGNVYTAGSFQGTTNFNPSGTAFNLTSAGADDIFVSKIDTTGNFVWAKRMGGSGIDLPYGLARDQSSNGGIYITGQFTGTADFDPGAAVHNFTSAGSDDIFLCKLDTAGTYIWNRKMGGSGSDIGHSIVVDPSGNGNLYTSGSFNTVADLDPGAAISNLTSGGLIDGYFAKFCQTAVPTISIATGSASFCQGDSVVLLSSPATTYLWGCGTITQNVSYFASGVDSVTTTDTNGCAATSAPFSYTMIPSTNIYGHVSYSGGAVANANVIVYHHVPFLMHLDTVQIVTTDGLGDYILTAIDHQNCLIEVFPDTTLNPTLVPTYAGNVYLWDSSLVIVHDCSISDTMNIAMVEEATAAGIGTISGHVLADFGFVAFAAGGGYARTPGDPVPGIDVKLGRNPGGQLVTNTQTDAGGQYVFSNLAFNTGGQHYTVYVDIPGLQRDSTYDVVVDATTNQYTNLDYYADSTTVYPLLGTATNVANTSAENIFSVYPNPSKGNATIQYTLAKNTNVSLSVFNVLGVKVADLVNAEQTAGHYKTNIDAKNNSLNPGIYFISLTVNGKTDIQKIIITE